MKYLENTMEVLVVDIFTNLKWLDTACGRAGRPHECNVGSSSTNHDSADHMSGQFLFYHENEAKHNDKSRDDHDDEPPCRNALSGNAIVMTKAAIDRYSVKIIDRLGMNAMIFVYIRVREDSIRNEQWYFEMKESAALNRLVSDVIINWHAQRARRKMSLIPSALPNILFVMACRWLVGIVKILKNDAMEPEEITNIEIYRLKFWSETFWYCTWTA